MKFLNTNDKKLFVMELNRVDLLDSIDDKWEPTSDLIELYVSKRKELIPKLRDFRKSQSAKQGWRNHRYNIMKGIKKYHKSTAGKRMHRVMGDFLATRESFEGDKFNPELFEVLKSLSSLKTHLWIENEYFCPLDEYVELTELLELYIPVANKIESKLLCGDNKIDKKDLEILYRIVEEKELLEAFSRKLNKDFNFIKESWELEKEKLISSGKTDTYELFYTELVESLSK